MGGEVALPGISKKPVEAFTDVLTPEFADFFHAPVFCGVDNFIDFPVKNLAFPFDLPRGHGREPNPRRLVKKPT